MTSAIDPSVIGAGNIDKASVRLQLERARDEITAIQADRVLKAGDTMTGDLTISKATPSITLNKAAVGQACSVLAQQAGSARWGITLAGATTSDFNIDRYNDSGVYQDSPISIIRATGAPFFPTPGLWRTALGATTIGSTVFTAADAAAVRTAIAAPAIPTATTSVPGTFTFINPGLGAAVTLPAGGTWACFGIRYFDGTSGTFGSYDGNLITTNVAAGGTTVGAAVADRFWLGFCWRIE
ncbi:hypothetical protein UFOVP568_45 [uncultured Caudovirales phage]|uniref:Uncharacterized protein n=1 Tax=uncultured Caudovirales phage TaxID=2100421 RepID=A0A6J5N022_9CAUD|nr:hypothetical protein UFOVP568_45 [uncultured Caudovirales phage]